METVERASRRRRFATSVVVCLAAAFTAAPLAGCRVNDDDVHRWENTAHGPDKLSAVLLHDKYDVPLRVEAALSLIRMKPRQGRRVGINLVVDTLSQPQVTPEARQQIVAKLIPAIIGELKKPPPVAQAGQPSPPDGSYPYKDAAYALLNADRTVIIADEGLKQSLKQALIDWAMADFEHRLDNRTQSYGMEQLLRYLGAPGVAGLPKIMTRDSKHLDQMAALVSELGDPKTKDAASTSLVNIAKYVTSDEWTKVKTPELQAANAASKLAPTEKQFQAQLAQYQDEELFRVFGALKKAGGRPAVDFCLGFAATKEQNEKRRAAALAALEGRLDRNNADDVKRILQIASTDAPDAVLDGAFRRIGEMPRERVVEDLYKLLKIDTKWKIRRAAAMTVLKMSTVKNLDEFMSKLPDGAAKGFAMPEALAYGASFGDLKEGNPAEAVKKWFTTGTAAQRVSALSYMYTYGTTADLPSMASLETEKANAPTCDTDPECKWSCEVAKEGAKDPAKEREAKDVKSVGDFVRYCIEPAMKERKPEPPKNDKK
jgi:hypothetical protein